MLAESAERSPGGKGNNQAIAAARAGADVEFIAAIGRDAAGDQLVQVLHEAGVGDRIRRVAEPTGTAMITVDRNGENTIIVASGSNATLVDLTQAEFDAITAADFLLLQLETPLATVVAAAQAAVSTSTRVVLNASPMRELPQSLLAAVEVLLVNEHEANALATGLEPAAALPDQATVATAMDSATILARSVPAVVITLGGDGAVVFDRDGGDPPTHVPAARVTPVDTTGAGDTYAGALVAALARGESLVSAAVFASAAGALAVQKNGAVPSIPTLAEIDRFQRSQLAQ